MRRTRPIYSRYTGSHRRVWRDFDPDTHVAAKIIEALVVRGEVQRAFELATSPAAAYAGAVPLSHAAKYCPPAAARRFLAAAFTHGDWETAARAAVACEPGLAAVIADEVAGLLASRAGWSSD